MDQLPCSPKEEIEGLVYFRRLCEKVRLMAAGKLHHDLHANLGKAMDLWACQFLGLRYDVHVVQKATLLCVTSHAFPSQQRLDPYRHIPAPPFLFC